MYESRRKARATVILSESRNPKGTHPLFPLPQREGDGILNRDTPDGGCYAALSGAIIVLPLRGSQSEPPYVGCYGMENEKEDGARTYSYGVFGEIISRRA